MGRPSQCRLGVQKRRRIPEEAFCISCLQFSYYPAPGTERCRRCPGSHSKGVSELAQASWMFEGFLSMQVWGKATQPDIPNLLLGHLKNVPPHSNLGAELKGGWGWNHLYCKRLSPTVSTTCMYHQLACDLGLAIPPLYTSFLTKLGRSAPFSGYHEDTL